MTLLELAAGLPERQLRAGDTIITQGDPGGPLHILTSGTVLIERDGVPVARVDQPGAVFGEIAVALGTTATASVRCESDVTIRVAEDAETFLAEHPEAAMELVRISAARVNALTTYLVDIKQQYGDEENHLGMIDTVLGALTQQQAQTARPGSARDPEG